MPTHFTGSGAKNADHPSRNSPAAGAMPQRLPVGFVASGSLNDAEPDGIIIIQPFARDQPGDAKAHSGTPIFSEQEAVFSKPFYRSCDVVHKFKNLSYLAKIFLLSIQGDCRLLRQYQMSYLSCYSTWGNLSMEQF